MQFQCDRCGKRYSTNQEVREGRAYRFTCRACGSAVIVRGPGATPPGGQRLTPGGSFAPPAAVAAEMGGVVARPAAGANGAAPPVLGRTPAPATIRSTVVGPDDAPPPPGGYVEFRLDDESVQSHTGFTGPIPAPTPSAAPVPSRLPTFEPPPPETTPALERPAPAFARATPQAARPLLQQPAVRLGLAAAIPAVVVAVVVSLLSPGGDRKAPQAAADPASGRTPGLLTPVVYVGPVELEAATPAETPKAAPPARGVARPADRAAPQRVAAAEPAAPAPADAAPAAAPPTSAPESAPPAAPEQAPLAPPAPAAATAGGAASAEGAEDAPAYARDGFRRPEPVTPGCVQNSIRIPRDLATHLPPSLTLRFAVGRDGRADLVQVLGAIPDPRVTEALRSAVTGCRFTPGSDEGGRPTRLWVVMPLRFAQ